MPAVRYKCMACGEEKRLVMFTKPKPSMPCRCGGKMHRQIGSPAAKVVETLDNGAMPRRVEQMKDIKEIMGKRSGSGENN